MRLSLAFLCACTLLLGLLLGTAEAVMVSFESPTYTAGSGFLGVDGWEDFLGATTVITPDAGGSGDLRVLEGSQSARLAGNRSIVVRKFDTGPTEYGTGTTVSGRMLLDGLAGTSGEFYFSDKVAPAPTGSTTPAGIVGFVGGNFALFGFDSPGHATNIDTGIPFATNTDYLLEIELDLQAQTFSAHATNRTAGGPRTSLGTALLAGTVTPDEYVNSGWALITRKNAATTGPVGIFDDVDVKVVPPIPGDQPLPGKVDFEAPRYVPGTSVVGVDGWRPYLSPTAVVTPDAAGSGDVRVLEGTKSLRLSGGLSVLQRNFGPGTTYDDGTIISARMTLEGPAGSHGEFFFSHNQTGLATPAGIVGIVGGHFFVFGLKDGKVVSDDGIDTGVPVLSNVDYLLEMVLDLTNQTFDSYVTNLTAGEPRVSLGTAELWVAAGSDVLPGDDSNSGYVLITRGNAVVIYDELNNAVIPEPSTLMTMIGLLLGALVVAWRRRTA